MALISWLRTWASKAMQALEEARLEHHRWLAKHPEYIPEHLKNTEVWHGIRY
ncbi:MAG: hypothetical protein Q8J68_08945 [Methanolobus sp.]|uniref:hypothetical protein n=1 Tax=Methanolobus sp. TaxID=1874737 RepID=UPI002730CF21|nr:hypothetical protein [Methanolobus sp.]MDP2217399.1 hypothetical protein [Methanolobus sp.]